MYIGKGCQTTIKFEFASSNLISLFLYFLCLNLLRLKKNFQKPNSLSLLGVFPIKISLYFLIFNINKSNFSLYLEFRIKQIGRAHV